MTDLTALPQLEIEIKFYLGQTAQNIIEVGKRLIQAKALVQHGGWQNWLTDNFSLTERTAQNFMKCADRFGKNEIDFGFSSTQMIALLSLPDAEETEKFIAEKAAEGKAVADMTIKQLREEIADYKKQLQDKDDAIAQQAESHQQSLFDFNTQLDERDERISDLEKELAEGQEIGKLVLLAEARLGELFNQMPKATTNHKKQDLEIPAAGNFLTIEQTVEIEDEPPPVKPKPKLEVAAEMGFNKNQVAQFQKLADNPDAVQKTIDEADRHEEIATRSKALENIKRAEKTQRQEETRERKTYTPPTELPTDKVKLICADIRDGLAEIDDNSVDFIITDPPHIASRPRYLHFLDFGFSVYVGVHTLNEFVTRMAAIPAFDSGNFFA